MRTSRSAAMARSWASARLAPRSSKTSLDLLPDAERRVQRGAGVLVDHRDDVAAVDPQRVATEAEGVLSGDPSARP